MGAFVLSSAVQRCAEQLMARRKALLGFFLLLTLALGYSATQVRLDPGFNSNAENRAVVVHGADYVCQEFVAAHGRLGRSQGCPALPLAQTTAIVQAIKGGSVLYLHGPAGVKYRSRWLNVDATVSSFAGMR